MVTLTHYHTSPMNCSQFQLLTHEGDCNQQPPTLLSFCRLISPPSVIYLFLSPWLGCGTACQPRSHHQRCSTHLRSDWKLNKTPKICRLLIHANTVYFSAYLVTLFHCCTTCFLLYVKCPSSVWTLCHYNNSFNNNNNNNNKYKYPTNNGFYLGKELYEVTSN